MWQKGLHDSGTCSKGLITNTKSGRVSWCTCPKQANCIRARGGHTTRETCPSPKEKTTGTLWAYPFMGGWAWLTTSRAGRLTISVSLGAQLDFASLESLQVTKSHYPAMGEVPGLDHCPDVPDLDVPASGTAWAPRATQFLFTDWGVLSKCNAL